MKIKRFSLTLTLLVVILTTIMGAVGAASAQSVCSPATAVSVPFAKDGAGSFCYQATSLCGYINSWNLTTLQINGTSYLNQWVAASSIPPLNGVYTINYGSSVAWGHFEIGGTCSGGGATATRTSTNPAATSTPSRTSTSGPSLTPSRTSTRTNTPAVSNTPTQIVGASPTRTATQPATATRTNTPVATLTGGFLDNMDSYNTNLFTKADGWTNPNPFNVGWRADHANFANGILTITLDNVGCPSSCSGRPYAAAEYRRNVLTGYGLYEARFKAAKGSGIVGGSMFIYTGPSDGQPWDEIDIEILGKDTTKMQVTYYTDGVGNHETMIDLGFDSAAGFHTYGFEYRPTYIKWFVDGVLVHTETGARGPLPSRQMKFMMNLWAATGADAWTGPFTYTGPLYEQIDWMKYTP